MIRPIQTQTQARYCLNMAPFSKRWIPAEMSSTRRVAELLEIIARAKNWPCVGILIKPDKA